MTAAATLSPHMEVHLAAAIFPMMTELELGALADDIKTNGQREPIELLDDAILDGRNRLAACELAGVEPCFRTLDAIESPIHYVLSKNLHRRHLTTSQRAMIAVDAAPYLEVEARERQIQLAGTRPNAEVAADLEADLPQGQTSSKQRAPQTRDVAGAALGVSGRSVAKAKEIRAKDPELAERVKANGISLDKAVKQIQQCEQPSAAHLVDDPPEYSKDELANVLPTGITTKITATTLANAIDELVSIPVADIVAATRDSAVRRQVKAKIARLARWLRDVTAPDKEVAA